MTRRWVVVCAVALLAAGLAPLRAEEKKEAKQDAKAIKLDGKWKWSVTRQNGQEREQVLTLRREGDKLTGAVTGGRQGNEIAITDGKVAGDGTLSFTVTRQFNNNTFTQKYQGKLEGETIKGTISGQRRNGQEWSRDWEAKRVTEAGKAAGTWRFERTNDNGDTITATLKLEQQGNKVTGTTQWADRDPVPIEQGKIDGNKLSFQVKRDNNGQSWTAKFDGEVAADALKGTVTVTNDQGEERSFPMEYQRVKE